MCFHQLSVCTRGVIKKHQDSFYLSKIPNLQIYNFDFFKLAPFCCYWLPPALLQLLQATLKITFSQRLHALFIEFCCITSNTPWIDLPFSQSYIFGNKKSRKGPYLESIEDAEAVQCCAWPNPAEQKKVPCDIDFTVNYWLQLRCSKVNACDYDRLPPLSGFIQLWSISLHHIS